MTQTLTDHDIISRLPRAPEKRSVTTLLALLNAAGHEVVARSLQRRLVTLMQKHPIECDHRSKPYGWSISSEVKVAMGELSVQEAVALKLSERYLGDAMPADLLDDLKGYFSLAESRLKHDSLYRAWLQKIRVLPASQPLNKPAVARNVHTNAYEGVLRGRMLSVTYWSRAAHKFNSYDVEPLAIVVRGVVTYLITRFHVDDEPALMALHRFKSIKLTDSDAPQYDFDLDSFIAAGNLGFMADGERNLRVRFYDGAGEHLTETPLALNQSVKKVGDDRHELTARLPITEQLKWWLFGFGDRAEVLAPQSLRAEFKTRMNGAARHYRTTRKS